MTRSLPGSRLLERSRSLFRDRLGDGSGWAVSAPVTPALRDLLVVGLALVPFAVYATAQITGAYLLTDLSYALVVAFALLAPWLGFLALIPLLPLNFTGVFGLGPIPGLLVVIGMSAAARVALGRVRAPSRAHLLVMAAGIAFVALTAAQLVQAAPLVGFPPQRFAFQNLGQVAGVILVLVVGLLAMADRDAWPFVVMYGLSTLFVSAIGILSFVRPTVLVRPILAWAVSGDSTTFRASGVIGNSNYFGLFAAAAGIFLIGYGLSALRSAARGRAWFAALAGIAALFALALSFSRAGILALIVGVVAAAFRRGLRWGIVAAAAGVFLVTVAYPAFLQLRLDQTFHGTAGGQLAAQNASDQLRFTMVKAALDAFRDAPLFGHGFSTFQLISPGYTGQTSLLAAHNMFLGLAAEQGIVGLVAFAILLAAILRVLVPGRSGVSIAALGAFVTFLAFGLTGDVLATVQASSGAWMVVALALATRGMRDDPSAPRRSWRLTVRLTP